jgi:hypothetical protein
MKNLSPVSIKNYLLNNYGEVRHNCYALAIASRKLAKNYPFSPVDVFHFIIENKPIQEFSGLQSYGFDTAAGRYFREEFSRLYDQELEKQLDEYDLPF